MDKNKKTQVVEDLKASFDSSSVLIVCHYHGVTVEQINKLRFKAKDSNVGVSVSKNTLSKIALEGSKFTEVKDDFKGPTMLIYAEDLVSAAKLVVDFAKENEFFKILSGCFNEKRIEENQIKEFSKLPSLDELRSKLIGILQAPAGRLVTITQEPAARLARVLNIYSNQT